MVSFQKAPMTALLALSLAFSGPAFAQSAKEIFEQGNAAYKKGEYAEAAELWEPLAEKGEVEAMENLAQLYRLGLGVKKDNTRAFELYTKAAEAGSPDAQVNAAFLLLTGQGVEKDLRGAALWFAKAADKGDALAQFNLGLMYEKGVGVAKDTELARELYQLAANQGQTRALARLDALESATPPGTGAAARLEREDAEAAAKEEAKAKAEAEAKAKAEADAKAKAAADAKAKRDAEMKADAEAEKDEEDAAEAQEAPDVASEEAETAEAPDAETETRPRKRIEIVKPSDALAENEDGEGPVLSIRRVSPRIAPESASREAAAPRPRPERAVPAKRRIESPEMALTVPKLKPQATKGEPRSTAAPKNRAAQIAMVKRAERAYAAGDFSRAQAILRPLAEAGMPVAQFWLGRMYNRGEGVKLDRYEAYSLWRSAAERGSSRAATALANLAGRLSPVALEHAEEHHRRMER